MQIGKLIIPIHNLFQEYKPALHKVCYFDMDAEYYEFYIYADNLNVPVFHVWPLNWKEDIAVCLFEPRIYQYTHDKEVEHFLPDVLDEFLRQQNDIPRYKGLTNWEALVSSWKNEHPDIRIKYDEAYKQPDYTKIEENPIKKRSFMEMLVAKWNA